MSSEIVCDYCFKRHLAGSKDIIRLWTLEFIEVDGRKTTGFDICVEHLADMFPTQAKHLDPKQCLYQHNYEKIFGSKAEGDRPLSPEDIYYRITIEDLKCQLKRANNKLKILGF